MATQKYADAMQEIEIAAKSLSPFVWVRTHEEQRFVADFAKRMEENGQEVFVWSIYQGVVSPEMAATGEQASDGTHQVDKALKKILNLEPSKGDSRGVTVIMRDPMLILQGPVVRQLRDSYIKLSDNRVTLVFLSPMLGHGPGGDKGNGLPPTMDKEIVVVDFALPDMKTITEAIKAIIRQAARVNTPNEDMPKAEQERKQKQLELLKFSREQYTEFARALQGLTHTEINVALSSCLHYMKTLNVEFLLQAKKQIISRSDILEYLDLTKRMQDIGGMDLAKEFFDDYKTAYSEEAQAFGVEPLKAILLLGIPGCGKSQLSKAIAHLWGLPLLRMDVGKVMTGLVGGSEQRMREAIHQVQAVSPCILWIDEVEKALSGTKSSNFSDGGTMARVFGTLLTAMEEGMKGVTVVATANDISMLPPEFIRRFDEVFFVDLPGPGEREEIFRIHLKAKNQSADNIDLANLVEAANNFTGHEIEKAVKRSVAFAFKSEGKVLQTEHILQALTETKPLYDTMHEKLMKLRQKASGRFRFASSYAKEQSAKHIAKQKKMDLNDIDLPDMKTTNTDPNTSTQKTGAGLSLD